MYSTQLYLCIALELTGLSRGTVLSSESETAPEDGAVVMGPGAGVACCCPVREEGDLDRLSIFGEPSGGEVPPGDTLDD